MTTNIPMHVAFIVDGNGRWATEKKINRQLGHKKGAENTQTIVNTTFAQGVTFITLYLFSIENWNRPKEEVDFIMDLLYDFLRDKKNKNNFNLKIIGDKTKLPENIQKIILENDNKVVNTDKTLILAISYSGKNDIINTCKKLISKNVNAEDITEELFSKNTFTGELQIPDPDLIIRTSGEIRISNFYLWQASYSEFYFCNKYWPDLNEEDIDEILMEYSEKRIRRYGKI
jgi:undecaprenyl diphosphate synthase